jgi:predicted ferric reductase
MVHRLSAAMALVAISLHATNWRPDARSSKYFLSAAGAWMATRSCWFVGVLYRNIRIGKHLASASVVNYGNINVVSLTLPRPWKFKPGQHIKICMPTLGTATLLQWHPFVLAWYEISDGQPIVYVIIKEQRGFTMMVRKRTQITTFIDGPYGEDIQLQSYGTILLFASGIGMAAQLLYVRRTLAEYDERRTSCRQIYLFWEIEDGENYRQSIEPYVLQLASHRVVSFL